MKKTIILLSVIAVSSLSSCKKAYTCDCTVTKKDSSSGTVATTTWKNSSKEYSEKLSKKQAESACDHEKGALQSTYDNFNSENGTTTPDPDYTYTADCTLK